MSIAKIARYALKTKKAKKFLSEAQKLIHKKKSAKEYRKIYKSVHKDVPLQVKGEKSFTVTKFQKPKHPGGGAPVPTQRTTHYGLRGAELKVGTKMARASMWHDTRARGSESWRNEMIRYFGGVHMSQTRAGTKKSISLLVKNYQQRLKKKKIKITKALRGTLVRKGTKLAYRLATKKFPELFKKKKFSIAELKTKKIKTPELASLGVTKTTALNLRKLAVAEVTKNRLTKLGNMAIKHQRKAVSLFWGKAKNFNQIKKLEKYHNLATKKKLESIGKQYENLTKYQETIKAKTATKHSEGGEVVISNNVDRSLL